MTIADARNSGLFAEWADYIVNERGRDAFLFLVGWAASLSSMTCHAQFKGSIRDFRFIDMFGEQPFSFITNRSSLLFYFQPPSVASGAYRLDRLEEAFDDVSVNARGEWTVRIHGVEDVQSLRRFLQLA